MSHTPSARLWAGPRDGEVSEVPVTPGFYVSFSDRLKGDGYVRAARMFHPNMSLCCEVWRWRADR